MTPAVSRRLIIGALMFASLGIQIAGLFLSVGYHLACGWVDSAGQVLGFNQAVTQDHFRLMWEALSVSEVLSSTGAVIAVFPAGFTLGCGVEALFSSKRRPVWHCSVGQSVVFVGAVAWLWGRAWAGRQGWTGESIVEGELSDACVLGIWLLAWLPAYGWSVVMRRWISPAVSAREWQAISSTLP